MEALAATIVGNFLVPYVKLGAEKLAEKIAGEAGDAAGEQAAGVAKKIWGRIREAFGADAGKAATLDEFERKPEAFAPGVEALLADLLTENRDLADELERLAESNVGSGEQTAVQIMADTVGYFDARGATISGGQNAGVIIGADVERVGRPPDASGGPGS